MKKFVSEFKAFALKGNMIDMAIMQIGAMTVPIYPTISEADYRHIISHSGMRIVILEGAEVMNKIKAIRSDCPELERIYTFIDRQEFPYLDQLIALGEANQQPEAIISLIDFNAD